MAKKTIKELENKLEHAEKSRDTYYQKWQELEDKLKLETQKRMSNFEEENRRFNSLTETLREIIRWQINPETAKSPFMPTKEQRDERSKREFY